MTNDPAHQDTSNDTLGSLLRDTRLARNLSIEDVAEGTRIHIRIIRNLEANDYTQMPAEVFVRGFIKLYSEFLELDPDESISRYVQLENTNPEKPEERVLRQHVLTGKSYAQKPVYQQSKRKIYFIAIGLITLVAIFFIGSLLIKMTRPTTPPKNNIIKQTKQTEIDEVHQQTLSSEEAELLVNRPPAITIEEDFLPEQAPATFSANSEPETAPRTIEHKLYKIARKKESTPGTSLETPEDGDESQYSTQEAEPPSPEPLVEKYLVEENGNNPTTQKSDIAPVTQAQTINDSDALSGETAIKSDQNNTIQQEEPITSNTFTVSTATDENFDQPDLSETTESEIQTGESPTTENNQALITGSNKPVTVTLTGSPQVAEEKPDLKFEPPPPLVAKYILNAEFTEPTWVRIQIDNKKPRQFTFNPGMTKTWTADRNIYLHLDNGGGVNLSLNGKQLPTGVPSGKVAKINIPEDLQ